MYKLWYKINSWKEERYGKRSGIKKTAEFTSFCKSLKMFPPSHIYSLKNWKWCVILHPQRDATSQKTETTLGRRRGKHGLSGSHQDLPTPHQWQLVSKGYLQGTINHRIMGTTKGNTSQLFNILLAIDSCGIYTMCMKSMLGHMFLINIW